MLDSSFRAETKIQQGWQGNIQDCSKLIIQGNHVATAASTCTDSPFDLTSKLAMLLNEFVVYFSTRVGAKKHIVLLGKSAGFLADGVTHANTLDILSAFLIVINTNLTHDYWIIDLGVTDHMTNQFQNLSEFKKHHPKFQSLMGKVSRSWVVRNSFNLQKC